MKSKEAIGILNACIEVLELVKNRVSEIEADEKCLYPTPLTSLRGSSDHIYVALSRIRNAVKWQGEADYEHQHNK